MSDRIIIQDLEAFYHVGVPDHERAREQRLLLCLEMETDFTRSAATDDLRETIDYYAVTQRLVTFGEGREWKLIEKLAVDIAEMVLANFGATAVTVTVKKFIIPETKYVAVHITRQRGK